MIATTTTLCKWGWVAVRPRGPIPEHPTHASGSVLHFDARARFLFRDGVGGLTGTQMLESLFISDHGGVDLLFAAF